MVGWFYPTNNGWLVVGEESTMCFFFMMVEALLVFDDGFEMTDLMLGARPTNQGNSC